MTWLYGGASIVGTSHVSSGVPCQDAFDVERSEDGKWIAAAVCDGAGSAKRAEVGSSLVAKTFAKKLILLSKEVELRQPGAWINDFVIQQALNVREELRACANGDDLRDFHTTLVAVLLSESGGFAIHIGDGAVFGGITAIENNSAALNHQTFISKPENGEYANETFFITEGDWVKHLRIIPIPSLDWIFIGTDGGAAFYLDPANEPKSEFISSFVRDIQRRDDKEWSTRIGDILNDKQAEKITNDDKTIIFFAKKEFLEAKDSISFLDSVKPTPIPPSASARQSEKLSTKMDKKKIVMLEKRKSKWSLPLFLALVISTMLALCLVVARYFFNTKIIMFI